MSVLLSMSRNWCRRSVRETGQNAGRGGGGPVMHQHLILIEGLAFVSKSVRTLVALCNDCKAVA